MREDWSEEKLAGWRHLQELTRRRLENSQEKVRVVGTDDEKNKKSKKKRRRSNSVDKFTQNPWRFTVQHQAGEPAGVTTAPETDMRGFGNLLKELATDEHKIAYWLVSLLRKVAGFDDVTQLGVQKTEHPDLSVDEYISYLRSTIDHALTTPDLPPEIRGRQMTIQYRDVFDADHCYTVALSSNDTYLLFLQTNFRVGDNMHKAVVWFERDRSGRINLCFCLRSARVIGEMDGQRGRALNRWFHPASH